MARRIEVILFDVQSAISDIQDFTCGKDRDLFLGDRLLQAGVERKLEIIGEAMRRLRDEFPEAFRQFHQPEKIISFRNLLCHGYDVVSPAVVWSILEFHLPRLREEVNRLLPASHNE